MMEPLNLIEDVDDDSTYCDSFQGVGVSERVSSFDSTNDHAEEENQEYFGHSENRNVKKLKNLVFLVLFLVTFTVCLVIYFLTRKGQEDEFEAS